MLKRLLILLLPVVVWNSSAMAAENKDCLDGFELTAISVLEKDIQQSVEAFACRMAFPDDSSTYKLYNQLRSKWKNQRHLQKVKRDNVYKKIYGDSWQEKIDSWTQTMALNYSQSFQPDDIHCQDLRKEMGAHLGDWEKLYQTAAREAAGAKYDPLRCETEMVIKVNKIKS